MFCVLCSGWVNAQPDLLLLKTWSADLNVEGWLVSEKLDGVRAYWDGQRLLSRQGNEFAAPDWFVAGFPGFELDGELWSGRGEFERISSIVSRDVPHEGWRELRYHVFEVPHAEGGLLQRLAKLRLYLDDSHSAYLRVIPQGVVANNDALQGRLSEVIALGGEGLVVRQPEQKYLTGRSAQALKVKRYEDAEAKVIGYRPGKGKLVGLVGALRVETAQGLRFYLGSGLTDQERRHPPQLGSWVTFKYYGLTAKGVPRFASYLRQRSLP